MSPRRCPDPAPDRRRQRSRGLALSRNDAIGDLAVVIAAVLIGGTGSPWPDIAVAIAIAGLFLHSSWHIIRDAHGEM